MFSCNIGNMHYCSNNTCIGLFLLVFLLADKVRVLIVGNVVVSMCNDSYVLDMLLALFNIHILYNCYIIYICVWTYFPIEPELLTLLC